MAHCRQGNAPPPPPSSLASLTYALKAAGAEDRQALSQFQPRRSVPVHPSKGGGTWNAGTDRHRGGPCHLERKVELEPGTAGKAHVFWQNERTAAAAQAQGGTIMWHRAAGA